MKGWFVMIDTEIILRGNAAIEFHNNMMSADLEAIEARDSFVSNVDAYLDEQGVLTIDISNISVDLAVLDENSYEIEAVPVSKEEVYTIDISIEYSSTMELSFYAACDKVYTYCIDEYYAVESVYPMNQSNYLEFAA